MTMEDKKDIYAKVFYALTTGGTILYPTDTIWGIGCDATNAEAVDKIYEIKKRPKEKSMIVLFASEEMLATYGVTLTDEQKKYIVSASKPVTIILSGVQGLAENVYYVDGTVGVRIVQPRQDNMGSIMCHHLITAFGGPIVSTSANINGEPSAQRFSDMNKAITDSVDEILLYDDMSKENSAASPSQIVRFEPTSEITIIRE